MVVLVLVFQCRANPLLSVVVMVVEAKKLNSYTVGEVTLPGPQSLTDIVEAAREVEFEVVMEYSLVLPLVLPQCSRLQMGRIALWRFRVGAAFEDCPERCCKCYILFIFILYFKIIIIIDDMILLLFKSIFQSEYTLVIYIQLISFKSLRTCSMF